LIKCAIKNNLNSKLQIKHEDSKKDGCLQAVDFISWAIFRKYEHNDPKYYELIKNKITIEKVMFS